MNGRALLLLVGVVPLALSGCGLRPVYAGGGSGRVAQALSGIDIGAIEGRSGWLVTNALRDRLHPGGSDAARYRLDVTLDDAIVGLGLRRDESVSRERRTLRARYRLTDAASGAVVLDATAASDAGIDVVQSEYAVIAAENTALERLSETLADQIVARLAQQIRRDGEAR